MVVARCEHEATGGGYPDGSGSPGGTVGYLYGYAGGVGLRLSDGAYSCTRRIDGMHRMGQPVTNTIRAGREWPGRLYGWPGHFAFLGAFPHVGGSERKGLHTVTVCG